MSTPDANDTTPTSLTSAQTQPSDEHDFAAKEQPEKLATDKSSLRLQAVLDEFKALRDEINARSTHCHTIININVVAAGTVSAFALGTPDRLVLLLILPVVGPVLGLLWLDHSYAIRGIGDYLDKQVRPEVNSIVAGNGRILGWESSLDAVEKEHKLLRFLPLGLPISLLFAGIPVLALLRVIEVLTTAWGWALWAIGLVLTMSFLTIWVRFLVMPWVGGRSTAFSGLGGGEQ
jgi:hypothetical protein